MLFPQEPRKFFLPLTILPPKESTPFANDHCCPGGGQIAEMTLPNIGHVARKHGIIKVGHVMRWTAITRSIGLRVQSGVWEEMAWMCNGHAKTAQVRQ